MAPCNACNRDLRHEHDGICVYVCIPRGSPVRSVKKYQQLSSNVQLPRFRFDGLAKNNLSRQSTSNKSRLSRRIILDRVMWMVFCLVERMYTFPKLESLFKIYEPFGFNDLSFRRYSSKLAEITDISRVFHFLKTIVNVETNDKIG